jgi:hypothetical protein
MLGAMRRYVIWLDIVDRVPFPFLLGFFQGKVGAISHRDRFDQIAAGAA